MALASNQDFISQGASSVTATNVPTLSKDTSIELKGKFTGEKDTEYNIKITELTAGVVSNINFTPSTNPTGLTNGVYQNLATTNVSSSGTGLTVSIDVKNTTVHVTSASNVINTGGSGYKENDTIKVAGNLIGGSTPANDIVLTILAVTNTNLKYQTQQVINGLPSGYASEVTPTAGDDSYNSIGYGLSLGWRSFDFFLKGEQIIFNILANGATTSDMFVLKTKDGSHLIKFWNGALDVTYNISTASAIDNNNNPTIEKTNSRIGYLTRSAKKADFAQINSKSLTVGLGGSKATPPKWVGMAQHKQWSNELNETTITIEDAELKIPKDVPALSDMVKLDTAEWYNAGGAKGGSSGNWTQCYFAGFVTGEPNLYVFRTDTNLYGGGNVYKATNYIRYGAEDTNLVRPLSISTDGPHLFVLDDVGSGLVHCYKFIGLEDSGDADSPIVSEFKKYSSNWPYALPNSPAGICGKRDIVGETHSGAWYSDIMVTPQDSRFNTSSGGQGRIWIQASWEFDKDNDYHKDYLNEDGEVYSSNDGLWKPSICGHTSDKEWIWSIDLANPAHPNGMSPQLSDKGKLLLVNRSPALNKFYKQNMVDSFGWVLPLIRGDYNIEEGGHPQGTAKDVNNIDGTNYFETASVLLGESSLLGNSTGSLDAGMGKKIQINEAGVMQLFQFGLTDVGEATRVGVSVVYSGSDYTKKGSGNLNIHYGHTQKWNQLYAEVISSSCFYIDSFISGNDGDSSITMATAGKMRDRLSLTSGNKPKEVEQVALPASGCVTFNIIDGTATGFTEKPLIIPTNANVLSGGYNQETTELEFNNSGWGNGSPYTNSNSSFLGAGSKPSDLEKVVYHRNGNVAYLVMYHEDGKIFTHNIEVLRAKASEQTNLGANSWNKETFFYKNPFHKENDNFLSTANAGLSASERVPGVFNADGTSTGLIQHPRAQNMFGGLQSGIEGASVAYRDRTTRASDRYTDVTAVNYSTHGTSDNFDNWENAYAGKFNHFRVFLLDHERGSIFQSQIQHSDSDKERMWDFTPTSIIIGSRAFLLNQRKGSWSYISYTNQSGILPATSSRGFVASDLGLTITGFDNVGNGSPADDQARISSPLSIGTSVFNGWWGKDTPPDGEADYSDANKESLGPDFIYYSFNLVYDGYQESPLGDSLGSSVDTNSGWTVQTTGDCLNIKITVPDIRNISRRVSHINIYRSVNRKNEPFAKAFYQLVENIALNDVRWVVDSNDSNKWYCTILDTGKTGETFETRTGVSELLENTMPHYGLSCEGEGYLFITQAWHQTADKNTNYIYRSKPGKYSVFDWSSDFLELPEYPSAISYYNGKLFAFSQTTTYMINPRNMVIEETFLQSGCLSNDAIVSSDYGMFWADKKSIWLYQGASIQNIGLPIEQGLDSSYRNRHDLPYSVHVEFDAISKCFCVFHKPKLEYLQLNGADEATNYNQRVEENIQAAIWAFHIEKKRWDYWQLTDADDSGLGKQTLSVCRDWEGGVLYMNKNGLFRLGTGLARKAWQWISKNFVMGFPTLDKRFYKIRAVSQNGSPIIQYKVDDALLGLGVAANEKVATKKGKRIKLSVRGDGSTAVDSLGIIYRKPKAK